MVEIDEKFASKLKPGVCPFLPSKQRGFKRCLEEACNFWIPVTIEIIVDGQVSTTKTKEQCAFVILAMRGKPISVVKEV